MVRIVDSFTRLYGRQPTEKEIGEMMRLQAEQDALKNPALRPSINVMNVSKISQERSQISAAKRPLKDKINVNIRGWMINCLLHEGYEKKKIGHILALDMDQIEYTMKRYNLPRDDLIKPKKVGKQASVQLS
jgi:transcriptional regulator with GAF, ATPase, and Fis domain